MTAMMTGVNTNQGVIGFDKSTEVRDFNHDGDGERPWTLLELAKRAGMKVGAVSTARITHATPAATYAHINNRDNENAIALQALPGDSTYNRRLGSGVDVLWVAAGSSSSRQRRWTKKAGTGSRTDGRDLRSEYQARGYRYVWNTAGFNVLTASNLPVLGLFERSHMEYEYDRPTDTGGEPSLTDMTVKAIQLLSGDSASRQGLLPDG